MKPFLKIKACASLMALIGVLVLALTGCESTGFSQAQKTGHFHTVVIDAGHGGHDNGAKSKGGDVEKNLTLDTTRRLSSKLREAGITVVETRTGDYFVTLDDRVKFSNNIRDSIFVSIHYNWAKRAAPRGIETFYQNPNSESLATRIQNQLLKVYSTPNRGVKTRGLYVLRNNRRPAVLCELGFVSNPAENKIIQDPQQRQRLAEAVARAIIAEKLANESI